MLNGIGAESVAACTRKKDLSGVHPWFIEPCPDNGGNGFTERNRALLAAFADDLQVCGLAERQVLPRETGHFSQTQSGLNGQQHQRVVAPSCPRLLVWGGEERINLRPCEISNKASGVTLHGRRQNPLNLRASAGQLVRGEPKERTDGSEPKVTGSGAHASTALQIVQEGGNQRSVELLNGQPLRCRVELLRRKPQQQSERIAVRAQGMRTDLLLLHQALREEALQQNGKVGFWWRHRARSQPRSRRRTAPFINAGCWCRYQYVWRRSEWPKYVDSAGKRRSGSAPDR